MVVVDYRQPYNILTVRSFIEILKSRAKHFVLTYSAWKLLCWEFSQIWEALLPKEQSMSGVGLTKSCHENIEIYKCIKKKNNQRNSLSKNGCEF